MVRTKPVKEIRAIRIDPGGVVLFPAVGGKNLSAAFDEGCGSSAGSGRAGFRHRAAPATGHPSQCRHAPPSGTPSRSRCWIVSPA
jgi:hypothetical protein